MLLQNYGPVERHTLAIDGNLLQLVPLFEFRHHKFINKFHDAK